MSRAPNPLQSRGSQELLICSRSASLSSCGILDVGCQYQPSEMPVAATPASSCVSTHSRCSSSVMFVVGLLRSDTIGVSCRHPDRAAQPPKTSRTAAIARTREELEIQVSWI